MQKGEYDFQMTEAFDISFSGFISSFIFSIIGLWLFREGKKQTRFQFIMIGAALMTYSYFTKGPLLDWGVGLSLGGLAYCLK